ncbi:MAG TPA: alpha/beta fold hydrolase, partial [Holophaga sp.]|nr:alpha/beta fold hydrolase [Holophaga sp.]
LTLLLSLPALLCAAEPSVREMALTTPDGFVLSGTLTVPEGRGKHPAVILVHGLRFDRSGWDPLVEKLNARGMATLAFDLRGHGKSLPQGGDSATVTMVYLPTQQAANFEAIPSDITLVANWLRKQKGIDGRHLGLAGANEGACAAMLAAAKVKPTAFLALSPIGAEAFGSGAKDRMVASTTRSRGTVMTFTSAGDQEAEDNVAPLRPVFGTFIHTLDEKLRGFEYLPEHADTAAVFFGEYLLHPHTGQAAKPKAAEAPAKTTDLTPGATPNP